MNLIFFPICVFVITSFIFTIHIVFGMNEKNLSVKKENGRIKYLWDEKNYSYMTFQIARVFENLQNEKKIIIRVKFFIKWKNTFLQSSQGCGKLVCEFLTWLLNEFGKWNFFPQNLQSYLKKIDMKTLIVLDSEIIWNYGVSNVCALL